MFCDFCIKTGKDSDNNGFVEGCSNLKLYSIKEHEISSCHLYAINKHINDQKPTEAPALKAKLSLKKVIYTKLSLPFRTVHEINIYGRPAWDYIWMKELDESKGLDIGTKYTTNINNCNEFGSATADVLCSKITEQLSKSKSVSFIVDGSMDGSITDNEMVYIQTCQAGLVCTSFIYCCGVQHGTAPRIVQAIQRAVETTSDWSAFKNKLLAIGSEGASVMLGKIMM